MTTLLSALLSVILLAQAQQPVAQAVSPSRAEQDQQDLKAERKRTAQLLAKAPRVEIEFTDNSLFAAQTLFEQMRSSRDPDQPASFTLKTPVNLDRLRDDIERVRFFLGTKGYLEAKISEPVIKDQGDYVKVTLPISTGARYRLGQIKVVGATVLTPVEIIEISKLKPGEVLDANIIHEDVFRGIGEAYQNRGYLRAVVDFIPNFKLPYLNAPEGAADVTVEIDEGPKFFMRAISFLGVLRTDEQKLRDLLLIREGEPYSLRKLRESVRQLNQLRHFEEIRDKDVMMRISAHDPWVEITIQVTKKDKW